MESLDNLEAIIPAFQQGSPQAFDAFFKAYYKPLVFFAAQLLADADEAEDIVKDCYVKLWHKHADFNHPKSIKGFLYTSTRNACLNQLRHRKVQDHYLQEMIYLDDQKGEDYILQQMVHAELLQSIHREIALLPAKRQQVFRMIYFEGLRLEAVAEQLGISVFTVKEHKAKALAQLRLRFSDEQLLLFFLLSGTALLKA
ncbi:RNA polymerase sigma-70 factor [Chitinophaga qingshengii]|uniref:RNA polymerase sigma-70 factor n=1 Tax=Chitinophaga qingshengii TaxID=1569794 RepID=A0ABR7TMY4_9BACT|nr:RNA polymerase sigma-70 factor [Chitinophaga qingshengii]MBC9931847.1 RNA polymerase sigma-70 factor [Chitinophaga qingshengii]